MSKKGKGEKPPAKSSTKSSAKPAANVISADERRAARNVAQLRDKLSTALDDPQMREQIVAAMRRLINEDKSS